MYGAEVGVGLRADSFECTVQGAALESDYRARARQSVNMREWLEHGKKE